MKKILSILVVFALIALAAAGYIYQNFGAVLGLPGAQASGGFEGMWLGTYNGTQVGWIFVGNQYQLWENAAAKEQGTFSIQGDTFVTSNAVNGKRETLRYQLSGDGNMMNVTDENGVTVAFQRTQGTAPQQPQMPVPVPVPVPVPSEPAPLPPAPVPSQPAPVQPAPQMPQLPPVPPQTGQQGSVPSPANTSTMRLNNVTCAVPDGWSVNQEDDDISLSSSDETAFVYIAQTETSDGDPDAVANLIAVESAKKYDAAAPVKIAGGWYEFSYIPPEVGVPVYMRVKVVNRTARIISYGGEAAHPEVLDILASVKFD